MIYDCFTWKAKRRRRVRRNKSLIPW